MSADISPPATPRAALRHKHFHDFHHAQTNQASAFERPAHVFNHKPPPPFSVLTELFSDLQKSRKHKKRVEMLHKWFNAWRAEIGNDLYPAIRLLVPQCDKERAVYGLKEQALAKIFTEVLGLDPKSPTALKLKNWKKPTNDPDQKGAGDFPSVLLECISTRITTGKTRLTIDEVNTLLDALAANTRNTSQTQVMRQICNRCSAEDQVWIVRIILKDLKISVKENTVFNVYHPSAFDIYNSTSDLKQVCWKLHDPHMEMNDEDAEVQLFQPFQPMLCKRPKRELQDVVKLMKNREFILEEKLDGERLQLHMRGKEFFYCSRKGKDYTYLYGQHIGIGSLTPFIGKAFAETVESVILDGEMLVWDPVTEHYLAFGFLKPAALDKSDDLTKAHPCFKVFDIVYLNGKRLTKWPLFRRKDAIRKVFQPIPGILETAYESRGKTTREVKAELERIMDDRGEGLVVKNPDSQYILNGREDAWLKVKPEYIDEMAETVDVLVYGGNWGTGKRGGGVSTLICAVRDDTVVGSDPFFLSFVRIGSGLSMSDFDEIRQKNWQPYSKGERLDFVKMSTIGAEDKPDVYLRPEDSFIITVKAAEIVTSEKYAMEWTMRFPRCKAIRGESDWKDCMTAKEINELRTAGRKRKSPAEKSQGKRRRGNRNLILPASFTGTSVRGMEVTGNIFQGLKFFVLEGTRAHDKTRLEKLIHEHGGTFQQRLVGDDLLVISPRLNFPKAKAATKKGYKLLTPSYLIDCIREGKILEKYHKYQTPEKKKEDEENEEETLEEASSVSKDTEDDPGNEWRLPKSSIVGSTDEDEDDSSDTDPESDTQEHFDDADGDSDVEQQILDDSVVGGVNELRMTEDDAVENRGGVEPEDIKMGEEDEAAEYDPEKIFRHLCFYLDTPANAINNKLPAPSLVNESIVSKFEQLEQLIRDNGGAVTMELDDPKLTHIVIDKRDRTRTADLRERTRDGTTYRQQVTSDFITDSLDDNSLVSESVYRP